MEGLARFRDEVHNLYRRSDPYDGRRPTMQDLAEYVRLDRSELSNRLNGTKRARLTHGNAQAIVKALAQWDAIQTQGEARELLALVDCPDFTPAQWQAPPLDRLDPSPVTSAPTPPQHNLPRAVTSFIG